MNGDSLRTHARLERLCSPAIWAEGPVWLPQEDAVVFSDVKGNRMFRWSRRGELTLYRSPSHYTNGNARDGEGRVVSCEHGRRGISRTESDGEVRLLIDRVDGKRFNSPNDVAVRSDGTLWFTDPPYGIIGDEEGYKSESQVIGCYLYSFDPRDGSLTIAACDLQRPNGLAFSPDEKWLYVADMSIVDFPTLGRRELRIYAVNAASWKPAAVSRRWSPVSRTASASIGPAICFAAAPTACWSLIHRGDRSTKSACRNRSPIVPSAARTAMSSISPPPPRSTAWC